MNTYVQNEVVSFLKTDEGIGEFSNMAVSYPMLINRLRVQSSEHLFQALKFPDHPSIQLEILKNPSPFVAKKIARKKDYKSKIRADWESIKLDVMDYCLRAKLINNWVRFGSLLRSTGHKDIVEITSKRDRYWGVVLDASVFRGGNNLGQLLTTLRNELAHQDNEPLRILTPSSNLGLKLNGIELSTIDRRHHLCQIGTQFSARVAEVRPQM